MPLCASLTLSLSLSGSLLFNLPTLKVVAFLFFLIKFGLDSLTCDFFKDFFFFILVHLDVGAGSSALVNTGTEILLLLDLFALIPWRVHKSFILMYELKLSFVFDRFV